MVVVRLFGSDNTAEVADVNVIEIAPSFPIIVGPVNEHEMH